MPLLSSSLGSGCGVVLDGDLTVELDAARASVSRKGGEGVNKRYAALIVFRHPCFFLWFVISVGVGVGVGVRVYITIVTVVAVVGSRPLFPILLFLHPAAAFFSALLSLLSATKPKHGTKRDKNPTTQVQTISALRCPGSSEPLTHRRTRRGHRSLCRLLPILFPDAVVGTPALAPVSKCSFQEGKRYIEYSGDSGK